jgi:hypothetical protein
VPVRTDGSVGAAPLRTDGSVGAVPVRTDGPRPRRDRRHLGIRGTIDALAGGATRVSALHALA